MSAAIEFGLLRPTEQIRKKQVPSAVKHTTRLQRKSGAGCKRLEMRKCQAVLRDGDRPRDLLNKLRLKASDLRTGYLSSLYSVDNLAACGNTLRGTGKPQGGAFVTPRSKVGGMRCDRGSGIRS